MAAIYVVEGTAYHGTDMVVHFIVFIAKDIPARPRMQPLQRYFPDTYQIQIKRQVIPKPKTLACSCPICAVPLHYFLICLFSGQ